MSQALVASSVSFSQDSALVARYAQHRRDSQFSNVSESMNAMDSEVETEDGAPSSTPQPKPITIGTSMASPTEQGGGHEHITNNSQKLFHDWHGAARSETDPLLPRSPGLGAGGDRSGGKDQDIWWQEFKTLCEYTLPVYGFVLLLLYSSYRARILIVMFLQNSFA